MGEQAERLELGELAAHGRRPDGDAGPLDERLRADGLAGRDVLLDDAAQDVLLRAGELVLSLQAVRSPSVSEQLGRDAAAEEVAARGERERRAVRARLARPSALDPRKPVAVERPLEARERQRLVEPETEHHALARVHVPRRAPRARAAALRRAASAAR